MLRQGDRHPEFIRTSREKIVGGIGAPACDWIASIHRTRKGRIEMFKQGDVYKSVRIAGRIWPLGNYMRKRIRDRLGIPQLARERQIFFENYDKETGEVFEAEPLPEDYCPHTDLIEVSTPWRNYEQKKAKREGLADLQTEAAYRARQRARRYTNTARV